MVGGYAKGEEEKERKEEDERDSCGQKNPSCVSLRSTGKKGFNFWHNYGRFKIITHTPFQANAEIGTASKNSAHLLFPAIGMMRIKILYHYMHLDPSLVQKKETAFAYFYPESS